MIKLTLLQGKNIYDDGQTITNRLLFLEIIFLQQIPWQVRVEGGRRGGRRVVRRSPHGAAGVEQSAAAAGRGNWRVGAVAPSVAGGRSLGQEWRIATRWRVGGPIVAAVVAGGAIAAQTELLENGAHFALAGSLSVNCGVAQQAVVQGLLSLWREKSCFISHVNYTSSDNDNLTFAPSLAEAYMTRAML